MQNVNLLDARRLPPQPLVRSAQAAAWFAAAALAVLAHAAYEQARTQQTLAALGAGAAPEAGEAAGQAGSGEPAPAVPQALLDLRARLAEREALLATLRAQSEPPSHPAQTLRDVLTALPEAMWLTEVRLQGARELRISGGTLDPLALAEFAQRLGGSASLRGVGLHTVQLQPGRAQAPGADAGSDPEPGAASARPMHSFVLASEAGGGGETP
ncbi:MAG: PilN domain-containing protein [Rubrivivax sp.]|nr:PilN domain-containing protein [Rubrivivax sp.]